MSEDAEGRGEADGMQILDEHLIAMGLDTVPVSVTPSA